MAKLLVTGGAGFIGANFVRYWRARHPGDAIAGLDALTEDLKLTVTGYAEVELPVNFPTADKPLATLTFEVGDLGNIAGTTTTNAATFASEVATKVGDSDLADGLAGGDPGYAERFGQRALGRQGLVGLEASCANGLVELARELEIERGALARIGPQFGQGGRLHGRAQ